MGDAFVAKIDPSGGSLVYSTYLGGNDTDAGNAIAVDSTGNAYVAGSTASNNFPLVNPVQSRSRSNDAFLAKLDPTGATLVYSTLLGGSLDDFAFGVAVDPAGNAYVTGATQSADFPTVSALRPSKAASSDAFVAKFDSFGTGLIYSTFFGGNGDDVGNAIAADAAGNAYVAGSTTSTLNFPLAAAIQPTKAGAVDGFVSKIDAFGVTLVFSTYLGGTVDDDVLAVALGPDLSVFVTGVTSSANFPVLGALQSIKALGDDAFVTKLTPAGTTLAYSTFLGGAGNDSGNGTAVHSDGSAYVTGSTRSVDFPMVLPIQPALAGGSDAFVSKIDAAGALLVYSTYLGGAGDDAGNGIALDPGAGVTVDFANSDGTATAGGDYTAASGTLTFAPGETSRTFVVPIINDAVGDGDETISLTLSNVTGGASIGPRGTAVLTIRDDERAVNFTAPVYTVTEGAASVTVTVARSGPTTGSLTAVSVDWATGNGLAPTGAPRPRPARWHGGCSTRGIGGPRGALGAPDHALRHPGGGVRAPHHRARAQRRRGRPHRARPRGDRDPQAGGGAGGVQQRAGDRGGGHLRDEWRAAPHGPVGRARRLDRAAGGRQLHAGHRRHHAVGGNPLGVHAPPDHHRRHASRHAEPGARAQHRPLQAPHAACLRRPLGTAITIIGAPAFLIASAVLRQAGRPGLAIFSIAPIGLALSVVGTVFILTVGRWLLPERRGAGDGGNRFRLDDYFTELTIPENSPFAGKTVEEIEQDPRLHVRVVGLVRGGRRLGGPRRQELLREADVLLVRATPEDIVAIRAERGIELHPITQYEADGHATATAEDGDEVEGRFVQAVVAPNAELAGRTISQIDFRRRYGAIVLSLWRRRGWLDQEIAQTRLRGGDVLVLQGDEEALARVSADPSFLMMVPFHGEQRLRGKAPLAGAIMLATIALAAFNVLSIEVASLAGAITMVLTGCLTGGQAYRAIDARIFVFIAGAIPLGAAMNSTGAADLIADGLQGAVSGWSQIAVLLALFAVVAMLTQFMSDAATTALFAPVAASLAHALGQPPEAYVVTVAMASVVAFLTPIGHHGNLLVYGPGGYRFVDFVRVGAPLTVLCAIVVTVLASMLWGGGGTSPAR